MAGRKRGKVSFGTVFMLMMTVFVLGASGYVLLRLSSGRPADLSSLSRKVLSLGGEPAGDSPAATGESTEAGQTAASVPGAASSGQKAAEPAPAPRSSGGVVTMTFGGTIALEENIRKSAYMNDSQKYDFTDIFPLLAPEVTADFSGVFLENLLLDDAKVSATVVPACAGDLLRGAGFNFAMTGFLKAWDKGGDGVRKTMGALRDRGITPLGLLESASAPRYVIREADGVKVAMMQYTDGLTARALKNMEKMSEDWMIPPADPEIIAADIAAARQEGAQAVVVLLNWGKVGGKNPEKSQLTLAQQIADSGADMIIGAGSRTPQRAEFIKTADGRQTLVAYSLGTLLSDNRSGPSRIGGYLLHVTIRVGEDGTVSFAKTAYTPTYAWRYRQDGKYYYRVLAADRAAPDGMDSDQSRTMQKTMTAVQNALEGTPLTLR